MFRRSPVIINNYLAIPPEWLERIETRMARIEDAVAALESAYGEMATRISDDVAELKTEITALVAKVNELTEQDTARLSALADRIEATAAGMGEIDPVKPEVPDAPPPVEPSA